MNLLINRGKTPEEILKRYLDRKNSRKPPGDNGGDEGGNGDEDPPGDSNFKLEELADCYRINGINYGNGVYDLSKELLPAKTQDQHAEHRIQVINNPNEFYTPDFPLFDAIVSPLYNNKDNQTYKEIIENARTFIKNSATNNYLRFLTRIQYNPGNQKDIVIHNYKQKDQYKKEIDSFIGPDDYIKNNPVNIENPLNALLNTTRSIQETNNIYKWLTEKEAHIWRINSEQKNQVERATGIGVDSVGVGLDCSRDLGYWGRAFGVRARKIKG